MRAEPDFGHGGQQQRLCVATLFKASFYSLSLLVWAAPGETSDLGLPNWMMATHGAILPLEALFLEQTLVGGALRWKSVSLLA
jgi:hypothetical protein